MSRRRDEELIQSAFDRTMSETQFEQFEARLHDEPELRALYMEYARMHHALVEEHEDHSFAPTKLRSLRDPEAPRRSWTQSILSAAAILVLLLGVAHFIGIKPAPPRTAVIFGPETNGQILNGPDKGDPDALVPGSRLVLAHGSAELTLPSGVRAVIEGPANLESLGKNEVRMDAGRGWFHVPPGAEGFTCHSGALRIIDLGTEFGVIANPDGRRDVHVFEGRVRVQTDGQLAASRDLHAGESITWNGGTFANTPPSPSFVTTLPHRRLVFYDDFSEADDTPLHGKSPDLGAGPWDVTLGDPRIHNEMIDTSGAGKRAFAPIDCRLDDINHILLVTIETDNPDARTFHSEGWAGVSLFTGGQEHVFVGDPFGPGSTWAIQPLGGQAATPTPPLRGKRAVTLRYDYRTGLAELFEGTDTRGHAVASEWISPRVAFDRIRIGNDEGGDIALRRLSVSVLAEPEG